jgi:two-component system KDP operon response regulator KdpE
MLMLGRRPVTITVAENFPLVQVSATRFDQALTHRMLLQAIWGNQHEQDVPALRVFVAQLRRKIETNPEHPRYILTKPGIGYRFCGGLNT